MGMGQAVALSAQWKRILAASFIMLGLAAAAAAFAIGFTGALTQSLADPASAPRLRAAALERLDESLGYGGYLGAYRAFLLTAGANDAAELRRLADEADASVEAFSRAGVSLANGDYASSLRRLAEPFQRTAILAGGPSQTKAGLPAPERLERNYAALKRTIAAAAEEAIFARIDDLTDALVWSETIGVTGLLALAAVLFAAAWYLREHLIAPLVRLRRSLSAAAAGAAEPVWGIERPDDIGAVARAAERLRERIQAQTEGSVPRLHLDIMERLAKGAVTLEADLSKASATNAEARRRIEEASLAAAHASHAAMEAANLARQNTLHLIERSEERRSNARDRPSDIFDAPIPVAPVPEPVARLEQVWPPERLYETAGVIRFPKAAFEDDDAAMVLDALSGGLARLETFARERRSIREDQQVTMTAALLQAVDRLNALTYAMADTDRAVIRAAE